MWNKGKKKKVDKAQIGNDGMRVSTAKKRK